MNRLLITVVAHTLGASCGEKREQPAGGGTDKGSPPQGGTPDKALTCALVADKPSVGSARAEVR
jgi:hypothetical protein